METFKPESENKWNDAEKMAHKVVMPVLAIVTALGLWSETTSKNDPKPDLDPEVELVSDFFEKPASSEIRKSTAALNNAVDTEVLLSNLKEYNNMISHFSAERIEPPMTNGEYLSIQARAIDLAQKKGVIVGDVIDVPGDTINGPGLIKYVGSIDIGDHITLKVVPPVFSKIYVRPSLDGLTLEFLPENIEEIHIADTDAALTDSEKAIKQAER